MEAVASASLRVTSLTGSELQRTNAVNGVNRAKSNWW